MPNGADEWTSEEFEQLLIGIDPHGRSNGACEVLRAAVDDYLNGGPLSSTALTQWMRERLDR